MIDWADENNSAWSRAQRSFQSPNGSHFSPLFPGRKTSRSVVKIKSGRTGNSKSVRPDSSRSTERPVLIEKRTPPFCKSRINCMQRPSRAGSLTRETRVPSKSMLRSRMFIVAGPAFGRQLLQHKCRELILSANGRSWATQLIVSIGCLGVERVDLTIDSIARRSKSKTERKERISMKSAYELAMERLAKNQPIVTLTDDQKKKLADVDSTFKARIAEKELFLKDQIRAEQSAGKFEEMESLDNQLASEIRRFQEDCEAKKEKLRASFHTQK